MRGTHTFIQSIGTASPAPTHHHSEATSEPTQNHQGGDGGGNSGGANSGGGNGNGNRGNGGNDGGGDH